MELNFNPIKERLLLFSDYKNFKRTIFYQKIDVKKANFSGKNKISALSSDKLAEILTLFPELSADWLILGNGDMIRNNNNSEEMELLRENRELRKQIDFLRMKIENMEKSKKLKNNHDSVCQM